MALPSLLQNGLRLSSSQACYFKYQVSQEKPFFFSLRSLLDIETPQLVWGLFNALDVCRIFKLVISSPLKFSLTWEVMSFMFVSSVFIQSKCGGGTQGPRFSLSPDCLIISPCVNPTFSQTIIFSLCSFACVHFQEVCCRANIGLAAAVTQVCEKL